MAYTVEQLCTDRGLRHIFEYLLPVIEANATITYGEVAPMLAADLKIRGSIFPTHIGTVVGTLMHRILEIDDTAPLLNVLVVNQGTGQPSSGANDFLLDRFGVPKTALKGPRRRGLVAKAAKAVYAWKGWPRIYRRLFKREAPASDPISLVEGTEADGMPPATSKAGRRFGGPAESEEHKNLKEHVFQRPWKVGAPRQVADKTKELMLLSGDEVDVHFAKGDVAYLIEVKSIRSNETDWKKGIYQCIKYRAVFQAQSKNVMPDLRIKSILVVEEEPPAHIRDLARNHGVRLLVIPVNP